MNVQHKDHRKVHITVMAVKVCYFIDLVPVILYNSHTDVRLGFLLTLSTYLVIKCHCRKLIVF